MKSQLLRGRLGFLPRSACPTSTRPCYKQPHDTPVIRGTPGSRIQGSFSIPPYVGYTELTGHPLLESHPSRGFPGWLLGPLTQASAHPSTSGPLGLCLPPSSPHAPSAQLRPPMRPKRPKTQRVPSQAQPQPLSSVPGDSGDHQDGWYELGAQADETGDAPRGSIRVGAR